MSGGGESLGAYVHPELVDCAKAVSILLSLSIYFQPSTLKVVVVVVAAAAAAAATYVLKKTYLSKITFADNVHDHIIV